MSFQLSDIQPYLPLAGQAISVLATAIESAIAAHKAGDPDAALAALEQAVEDATPVMAGMKDALAKVDADIDAYEAAKFPDVAPTLATTAVAISDQLKMRFAPALPMPELVHDTSEPAKGDDK